MEITKFAKDNELIIEVNERFDKECANEYEKYRAEILSSGTKQDGDTLYQSIIGYGRDPDFAISNLAGQLGGKTITIINQKRRKIYIDCELIHTWGD